MCKSCKTRNEEEAEREMSFRELDKQHELLEECYCRERQMCVSFEKFVLFKSKKKHKNGNFDAKRKMERNRIKNTR